MSVFSSLCCSLTLLFFSTFAFSQKNLVSLGGNVVLPTASGLKRVAGSGFGGSVRLEASAGKHTYVTATFEYLKFAEKATVQQTATFKATCIQVGIKYFVATKEERVSKGVFISGEVGIMPSTTNFTYTSNNRQFEFKESGLSVAMGLGYQLAGVEASLRPQFNLGASGFNVYYLNVRLAYALLR